MLVHAGAVVRAKRGTEPGIHELPWKRRREDPKDRGCGDLVVVGHKINPCCATKENRWWNDAINEWEPTHSVFGQHFRDDRADYSGDGANAIRHSHQYAGVARCNIKMINVEACMKLHEYSLLITLLLELNSKMSYIYLSNYFYKIPKILVISIMMMMTMVQRTTTTKTMGNSLIIIHGGPKK